MLPDLDDLAWLSRIYRETIAKLDDYANRVNEGQDLMAALEFASWVIWSGLTRLCERHARKRPKIDGSFLYWKATELQREVRARLKNPNSPHQVAKTQLERIHRKLDLLAGMVAKCVNVNCDAKKQQPPPPPLTT